jgi:hypothetical protein
MPKGMSMDVFLDYSIDDWRAAATQPEIWRGNDLFYSLHQAIQLNTLMDAKQKLSFFFEQVSNEAHHWQVARCMWACAQIAALSCSTSGSLPEILSGLVCDLNKKKINLPDQADCIEAWQDLQIWDRLIEHQLAVMDWPSPLNSGWAWDLVTAFRDRPRKVLHSVNATVLLVRNGQGVAVRLVLESLARQEQEKSGYFVDPEAASFIRIDDEFLKSFDLAKQSVLATGFSEKEPPVDVRWKIVRTDGKLFKDEVTIEGGSAGGIFALGLGKLLELETAGSGEFLYQLHNLELEQVTLTTGIDAVGKLSLVGDIEKKIRAGFAENSPLRGVGVSTQQGYIPPKYLKGNPGQKFVIQADTLVSAVGQLYTGWVKNLLWPELLISWAIPLAVFQLLFGSILWSMIVNPVMGWVYYLGGSGNEPHGFSAFIWGALLSQTLLGVLLASHFLKDWLYYRQWKHTILKAVVVLLIDPISILTGSLLLKYFGYQNLTQELGKVGFLPLEYLIAMAVGGCILFISTSMPLLAAGWLDRKWIRHHPEKPELSPYVALFFYLFLAGTGAVLFYDTGIRTAIEAYQYDFNVQEIIIACLWSLILTSTILALAAPFFILKRVLKNEFKSMPSPQYLILQVPLTIIITVIAVMISFIWPKFPAIARGIMAGLGLRVGLFLGISFAIFPYKDWLYLPIRMIWKEALRLVKLR